MALIVEDGVGRADADSYLSVASADAYCAAMGHVTWAGHDMAGKEAALRRATQYLDARYRFRGERLTQTQALQWPRRGFNWPQRRLLDACAELAVRAASQGSLYEDPQARAVTRETVGPITVEYDTGKSGAQPRFSLVDDLLSDLIDPNTGGRFTLRLERAS